MPRPALLVYILALGCSSSTVAPVVDAPRVTDIDTEPPPDAAPGTPDAAPAACSQTPLTGQPTLIAAPIASGLSSPVGLFQPHGDARLFIIEQSGKVRVVKDGNLLDAPFLDLSGIVSSGNEQGLLGLAFHPSFASNGRFFIYYTDQGNDAHVVEYHAAPGADVADAAGTETLFIEHPYSNHNGGNLAFGPDGKLYIGVGDGGSEFDPMMYGQDTTVLLSKMLRLDVDLPAPHIPPDNPYVGMTGFRPEIWANGLRNPWRWSFDRQTGDMWIGDVGQSEWEEIDFMPAGASGLNYGWSVVEGNDHCPNHPTTGTCALAGSTLPVYEVSHAGGACAIIGGFVYRGCRMPGYAGTYFFSDNCTGWIKSFAASSGGAMIGDADVTTWDDLAESQITSLGEDDEGELYICARTGSCYKIEPITR